MDELLLQALATFSAKLKDNDALYAIFEPEKGEPDDNLDQAYKMSKAGGEYTDGAGAVVKGVSVFSADIARYGDVIDGITDYHGKYEAAFPPFAALVVRPKNGEAGEVLEPPFTPLSSLPTKRGMLPATGSRPSSSLLGAGLPRRWTGSTMPHSLPLSVGRPHRARRQSTPAPVPHQA